MKRLISFVGFTLFLAGCAAPPSKFVKIDSALADLVPADTTMLVGLRMDAVRATPVYRKYIEGAALPQLNDFVKRTGIDPRKDLREVLSCGNGKTAILLVDGSFHVADLEKRLQAQGAKSFPYKKYKLFGDDKNAVGFVSGSVAVAGNTDLIHEVLDGRDSGKDGVPAALRAQVDSIGTNRQVWFAMTGGLAGLRTRVEPGSMLGNLLQVLQGIDTITAGADLRNGFDLDAHASCKTDKDAKRLRDAVKGAVGFGRLSTPEDKLELLKLYDGIQVEQQNAKVAVSANVPADLEERFIDLWTKGRR